MRTIIRLFQALSLAYLLAGLPLAAADPAPFRVVLGDVQFITDEGLEKNASFDRLAATTMELLVQRQGAKVELMPAGWTASRTSTISTVDIKAIRSGGQNTVIVGLTMGKTEVSKTFLKDFTALDAKTLSSAVWYLLNQATGFAGIAPKPENTPYVLDRMDISQTTPLGMTGFPLMPYSIGVKANGNVLVALYNTVLELDREGRTVGHYGLQIAQENAYFAYDLRLSASGTLYTRGAAGGSVYSFVNRDDQPRTINTQIEQPGSFLVLDDGSLVVKDMMSARTVRFEGRKKTELNVVDPAYPWVQMASGPDSTIRVLETISGEVRVYDRNGSPLENIMLMMPIELIQKTMRMVTCPDGSMLLQGSDFLARVDREGVPLWIADKSVRPDLADNQMAMGMAFDPGTGSIYLVKSMNKEIIRIADPAWIASRKIDMTAFKPLAAANAALLKDPEDWDAIQAKYTWYRDHNARDLAHAALVRLAALDSSDREVQTSLNAVKLEKFLAAAETSRIKVLATIRDIGPETARADYQTALKLYEQAIAIDPGNRAAAKARNDLVAAMKQAEGNPDSRILPQLGIASVRIDSLYPALSATYRVAPFGSVRIVNDGETPVKNIKVSVSIPRFTDFPTELAPVASLAPGASVDVPLTAALNREVLTVEEDLPIQAQVAVSWEGGGTIQKTAAATLYRRTALTWDKSGKLSSFITPNEETINTFALRSLDQAAGAVPTDQGPAAFSARFWRATAIADALGSYGIAYLEDPQSPISRILGAGTAVDTVRFPRTTLYYRSGDCDDTTALLASLLEAAGIQTAILTTPGHVFLAFDTGESADSAWIFGGTATGSVIIRDRSCWIPVESTLLSKGFAEAWKAAAKLVAQYRESPQLEMLPVHEQWKDYPSIPLPQSPYQILLPPKSDQARQLVADYGALGAALYEANVSALQAKLPASGKARVTQLNRIGILHARFGAADKATAIFRQAIAEDPTGVAASINLASLLLQSNKPAEALPVLQKAAAVKPDAAPVQLLLAQAWYSLGDKGKSQQAWLALSDMNKDLASQYSWLSGSSADPGARTGVERASNKAAGSVTWWTDSGE